MSKPLINILQGYLSDRSDRATVDTRQRLKRSGSRWNVEKAWAMLALRMLRENQDWQAHWLDFAQTYTRQCPKLKFPQSIYHD